MRQNPLDSDAPPGEPLDTDRCDPKVVAEFAELRDENLRLKERLATVEAMAYRDPLTGLRNEQYLAERLAEEAGRGRRDPGYRFSVMIVELQGLIGLRDRGDSRAEEVLWRLSKNLRGTLRQYDVCCRNGPQRLVAILPGADATAAACTVARLGRRLAESSLVYPDLSLELVMGHATWPDQGKDAGELLERAAAGFDASRGPDGEISELEAGPIRIQFEGLEAPVRVRARPTDHGYRIRSRLPFLRVGSLVRLLWPGMDASSWGQVLSVKLSTRGDNPVPLLEVDLARDKA